MRSAALCMGLGGLDLAVEAHYGADLAWCAEWEDAPSTVIERHWPGVPNLRDLTKIDWAECEPVDILTAGYPCQPFSHAGLRKGTYDVRHLWPHIAQAVRVLRPRRVVLENVAGHLTLGFGDVLRDLAEAGFDAEWGVLRASDVGTCHRRARLFIVASQSDSGRRAGGGSGEPAAEGDRREGRIGRPAGTGADVADAARSRPEGELVARRGEQEVPRPGCVRVAAPDAAGFGHQRARAARGWRAGSADGPVAGPVAGSGGGDRSGGYPSGVHDGGRPSGVVAWGVYADAIDRWERVLGRVTPAPTDEAGRLAPAFVEWMMGYPAGWVDGLTRGEALKALGNAVVPLQAAAALGVLDPVPDRG